MTPTLIISVLIILLVTFVALKILVASIKMAMRIGITVLILAAAVLAYFQFLAN